MNTVGCKNGYALVPLSDFPFSGDFVCVDDKTGSVLYDSRTEGYDLVTDCLISWVELIKDESVPEGAVYKFYVVNPSSIKEVK